MKVFCLFIALVLFMAAASVEAGKVTIADYIGVEIFLDGESCGVLLVEDQDNGKSVLIVATPDGTVLEEVNSVEHGILIHTKYKGEVKYIEISFVKRKKGSSAESREANRFHVNKKFMELAVDIGEFGVALAQDEPPESI